jgi:uncharacterized protein (TIGR03083 family)
MPGGALTALTLESQALSAVLHELEPEDLTRRTNCPPWDLQELVVHIADSIRIRDTPFPHADPGAELRTAADYYRRPERDTPAYRQGNVEHTQQLAQAVLADTTAVRWFDEISRHAITTLSEQDPDQAVLIPHRGAMRLTDWIITRVVSVAAHGLDVAITLDRAPWTTPSALHAVRPVFVSLLGTRPPETLNWDDRTLLATGAGRRTLTTYERELLGPYAQRFPLLS